MDNARHNPSEGGLTTRILIADDDMFVRTKLAELLSDADDIEVTGVAADGAEILELVRANPPDVILMDINMPVIDGVEATRLILREAPAVRVIALTSLADEDVVAQALNAGAVGYLFKNTPVEGMLHALRATRLGLSVLSPSAQSIADTLRGAQVDQPDLSTTELNILRLVCEGLTNEQIAEHVHLSQSMVKYHLHALMAKLGVTNRVRLAVRAAELHLV